MKEIKLELASLRENFMKDMKEEMDRRGFASSECNTIKITSAIASLAARIETMGTVNRIQPTPDEETMRGRLATFVMEDEDYDDSDHMHMLLEEDQAAEIAAISEEEKQLHIERNHQQAMDHVKKRKLTMGSHHGLLTPLPSDWEFPSMTWSQLIENWFLGNQRDNLPPIIDLDSKLVKHCNKGSGNRMRGNMVAFMRVVEMEAREKSCWKNNNREWTNEYVRNMIDEIRGDFTKKYMLGNNRKCENSWSTVYGRMSKTGAFRAAKRAKRAKRRRVVDNARK